MAKAHVVVRGECLSKIARSYGIHSWKLIYHHPDNKEFRSLRPDPNVIFPGDVISIPDLKVSSHRAATDVKHRFRLKGEPTWLRLDLWQDIGKDGVPGRYELTLDNGRQFAADLGSDGRIDVQVPADAGAAQLSVFVGDSDLPFAEFDLHLGELDPIDTMSGVQARLRNLAFDPGPIDGICGPRTRKAIRAFQRAVGVEDDEDPIGDPTRDKLKSMHGA